MPASLPKLTEGDRLAYGARDWIQVTTRDLGHGHVETTMRPVTTLAEVPEWWGKPKNQVYDPATDSYVLEVVKRGEGDREASRAASVGRAKRNVRLNVKSSGATAMGTLTYKDNVQDRDVVLAHFKEFIRRVRKTWPWFGYTAVLEHQKRGALHVHFAYQRLPARAQLNGVKVKSYQYLTAVWRSVIKGGGAFNDSSRKHRGSPLKIAKYMSKYMGKAFDAEEPEATFNKKRHFSGGERCTPRVQRALFNPDAFADAYQHADAAHGGVSFGSADIDVFQTTRYGGLLIWVASYTPPH